MDPKTQFVGITSYKVGSSFFATFLLAPKEKKKKKKSNFESFILLQIFFKKNFNEGSY